MWMDSSRAKRKHRSDGIGITQRCCLHFRQSVCGSGWPGFRDGSGGVGRRDFERLAEQWAIEPAMGELVDGVSGRLVRFAGRTAYRVPNRVRKLKALGNAVVPQVGEFAARILMNRLKAIDRDKSRQLAFT